MKYNVLSKFAALRKSSLARSSFVYTITNFISKAFPFFILPLFTRALSLEEYGDFAIYRAATNFCMPLIGLSLSEAITRYYYERDKLDYNTYISSVLIFEFFTFLVSVFAIIIISENILSKLGVTRSIIIAAIIVSFLSSLINVGRSIFRCANRTKLFSILVIGQAITYFVIVGVIYIFFDFKLSSAIYSEVAVYFLFMIIGLVCLNRLFKLNFRSFNLAYISTALKYSLPLVIHSFMSYAFALSDRFIISYSLGKKEVAIYSVAFQIASIIQILAVSFNAAWTPWIYENLKKKISYRKLLRVQVYAGILFISAALVYWLVAYAFLPFFAGTQYNSGLELLFYFIAANILQFFYWVFAPILKYFNKNWLLIWSSIPALIFSVSFNFAFLPRFGIKFAAIVYVCSWFIIFSITVINSIQTQRKNLPR